MLRENLSSLEYLINQSFKIEDIINEYKNIWL
jgi:hypothetical protein